MPARDPNPPPISPVSPRAPQCSFCSSPITWGEVLSDNRILCPACKPCLFFERNLTLTGDYAGRPFKLMPWMRDVLRDIFGTLTDEGLRAYRDIYLELPSGSSKTSLCAGLVLYFLINSGTSGTEVYSAATAKDQAAIVFRYAQQMLQFSPLLARKLKALPSVKTIMLRDDPTSFYKAISADGDVHDGVNPSFVVRDEIHRWRTRKALELNDLLERKMVKRFNALTVDITTAGEETESPLGWRRHEYARRITEGVFEDRRFYGRIWSADPKRIEKEPGFWMSKEARVQANPSHEDNQGYIKDSTLEDACIKAQNDPQLKADYLRFNLNIWGSTSGNRAIDMSDWAKGDVPLRSLVERPCWGGLDLSTSIDLTAFVLIFPWEDVGVIEDVEIIDPDTGEKTLEPRTVITFDILPFFWMPKDNIRKRELKDKVTYAQWAEQGFLETTEGNEVDYSKVRAKIEWASEVFDLQEVDYDPCQANETVQYLDNKGIRCYPIKQGFVSMSAPTKRLLELVKSGRIRHAGHPVLRWCADSLMTKGDGNDLIRPVKPDRLTNSRRIDGMIGIINGLARYMVSEGGSVYETSGLKFL